MFITMEVHHESPASRWGRALSLPNTLFSKMNYNKVLKWCKAGDICRWSVYLCFRSHLVQKRSNTRLIFCGTELFGGGGYTVNTSELLEKCMCLVDVRVECWISLVLGETTVLLWQESVGCSNGNPVNYLRGLFHTRKKTKYELLGFLLLLLLLLCCFCLFLFPTGLPVAFSFIIRLFCSWL